MTARPNCGTVMTTFKGNYVDPLNLHPDDIHIEDIAHHLSMQCRFAGACKHFYSVAQHSVHMATQMANTSLALEALLHDAPEYLLVDIVRCVKSQLPAYKEMEKKIWSAVVKKFNLQCPPTLELSPEVHEADMRMLVTERRQIIPDVTARWDMEELYAPYTFTIPEWTPEQAEVAFLSTFMWLTKKES